MSEAWLCPDCRWAFPKSSLYSGVRCLICPRCNGTNLAPENVVRRRHAEDRMAKVRNALAMLDGHTCHEGHTEADLLRLYRAVIAEIEGVLA